MIVSEKNERWRVGTPELRFPGAMDGNSDARGPGAGVPDTSISGTGDLCTALFLSAYIKEESVRRSLEYTADAMFGVLTAASRAGSRELMLTAAQDELISPSTRFTARRIG